MTKVFVGERRRNFDQWWDRARLQHKFPEDPKQQIAGLQGDFMLICMRAYEQGRQDECADSFEIEEEIRTTGRVRRASDWFEKGELLSE